MPIETIIIEFQANTDALVQGENKIADSMKKVNTELSKQQQELGKEEATLSKLTGSLSKLSGESKKGVEQLLKLGGKEVVAGFDKLGLSVDEYIKSLQDAEKGTKKFTDTTVSSRKRLTEMREELLRLADQGKANTKEFQNLQRAAGKLADDIQDVQSRIKATGSDTRVFDGLINAAQGVAGGFAVMQGAAALFGNESEELQETLLRVNSAMAILQGLQQVQQVLQKESAASLLFLSNAQKVNAASTLLATGIESKNIIVKYASIAATKALALAQALANPVTLAVVAAIVAVTAAYKFFTRESEAAAEAQKLLNLQLEAAAEIAAGIDDTTKKFGERRKAQLKAQGASEREIRAADIKTTEELLKAAQSREESRRVDAEAAIAKDKITKNADERERLKKTIIEFEKLQQNRIDLQHQLDIQSLEDTAATNAEQNKLSEQLETDRLANLKKGSEKRKALQAQSEEDQRKSIQKQIDIAKLAQLNVDKETFAYRDLEVQLVKLDGALESVAQTEERRALIAKEVEIKVAELTKGQLATIEHTNAATVKDYEITGQKIIDSQVKVNNKMQGLRVKDVQENKMSDKERVDLALQTAGQISGIFAEAFRQQTDREVAQVDEQRQRLKDLEEAGAITAKEAEKRVKLLDEKERQIKLKGAIRDKAIAIFQATIATAQAVVKSLAVGLPQGAILAAIAGALGAAQIALIASRPIPKFKGGKKGSYEGFGIVGESGAELIERNGRMEVAHKEQLVWLNKQDKVYTPKETAAMLMDAPPIPIAAKNKTERIDYDKMGKSIAKHLPQHNISFDKDGFSYAVKDGQNLINYLDKRRSFGRKWK